MSIYFLKPCDELPRRSGMELKSKPETFFFNHSEKVSGKITHYYCIINVGKMFSESILLHITRLQDTIFYGKFYSLL